MRSFKVVALLGLIVFTAGCYHATIDTGLTPGTQVIHKPFASAWIYGLIPPKNVETMAECPHGVAKVETQLSFVNQLVGFVTLGIYTPMEIKVTCAMSGTSEALPPVIDLTVSPDATTEELRHVFQTAADRAVASGQPVYVSY